MSLGSNSCFSKRTGKPLTEYDSIHEAQKGANYANSTYGNNLIPYKCKNCGLWHLSPKDRQTPSSKCHNCTDGNGRYKDLYHTKEIAERRRTILYKEKGIRLNVYKCPYHNSGWHLTKATS